MSSCRKTIRRNAITETKSILCKKINVRSWKQGIKTKVYTYKLNSMPYFIRPKDEVER